jgi:hypothetical protein
MRNTERASIAAGYRALALARRLRLMAEVESARAALREERAAGFLREALKCAPDPADTLCADASRAAPH